MLTQEQIVQFYRDGYLVVEGLVPADVADEVVEANRGMNLESGGKWTPKIFDRDNPTRDAETHRLLTHPRVVEAVEDLLEAPARVFFGMLAVVPARGGEGLKWHQDNMYSTVLGRALNTFVALCDITPDMAILHVAPRSHAPRSHVHGVLAYEVAEDQHRYAAEPENGMPLPGLRKGDACIFDRNTLHHSKSNTTDRHRYAYAAQYMEAKGRLADTGELMPGRALARDLAALLEAEPARS